MDATEEKLKIKIEELRRHMEDEGESFEHVEIGGDEQCYELKVKLTGKPGADVLYLVPSSEDWIHDALDDVTIIPGTIYAEDEPFVPDSTALTGYFQADETQKWVYVVNGSVPLGEGGSAEWVEHLEDFPEVIAQFEEAMEDPSYRHQVEQAMMKQMLYEGIL